MKKFDIGDRVVITDPALRGVAGYVRWPDYGRSETIEIVSDAGQTYIFSPVWLRHESVVERLARLA